MPDITLSPEKSTRSGLQATYTGSLTIADDYYFLNSGETLLHVKSGAAALQLTIETVTVVDGQNVDDRDVTIPATSERFVGPFPPAWYNDPSRRVHVTFTAGVAGASVAVVTI